MPFYFEPHSPEWFSTLELFDPSKAAMTRMVIELAGGVHVCSICGDNPAHDYQLVDPFMQRNAVATIRLCDDCPRIKKNVHRERFIAYKQGNKPQQ